jgi:hypothetical protein
MIPEDAPPSHGCVDRVDDAWVVVGRVLAEALMWTVSIEVALVVTEHDAGVFLRCRSEPGPRRRPTPRRATGRGHPHGTPGTQGSCRLAGQARLTDTRRPGHQHSVHIGPAERRPEQRKFRRTTLKRPHLLDLLPRSLKGSFHDITPMGRIDEHATISVVGAENYVRLGHGGLTMVRDLAPAGPFRLVASL